MSDILIVEDDPLNMELVAEILRANGFIIDMAENGEEAIKKAETKIYDLILMDIELPEMGGVEATRLIKIKPDYKNIPIIALTSYAMKGDKERFMEAGFDEYIPKPINVSDFLKKVEKYCNKG
jgi:CheY-like chemotaxis protein